MPDRLEAGRRPVAHPDAFRRAVVATTVSLGWLFLAWALLSAARA